MAFKTKKLEVNPQPRPARYVTVACARCGQKIDQGTMVEALPYMNGGATLHRWVHQGCSYKAPYNCLDSDGNPSVDGKLQAKSTESGIKNSEVPPPTANGDKTEIQPHGSGDTMEAAVAKGVAEAIYENLKADDEYWAEGGLAKGGDGTQPQNGDGKNGKGKVEIPGYSPELEDWVRVVVRDELTNVLPKVMKPVIDEIGNRFNQMNNSMVAFCKDVNDWRDTTTKYFKEQMEALLKTAGEVQIVKQEYTIKNHTKGGQEKLFDTEVVHEIFPKVLDLATCSPREHIFIAGPSGSGKSYLAGQVAKALDVPFGYMSCSGGINEAHLLGRTIPNVQTGEAVFVASEFVKRYEEGGLFLLDEIDAADPNVLIVLNNALANGMLALPARTANPYAKKHDDFICMVAANTFGRGSSRMYVGRNQLDEATLDRFRIGMLSMDYSATIEKMLCPIKSTYDMMIGWRKQIEAAGMRRVLSTRFMAQAHRMMEQKGWTKQHVYDALTTGWSPDEKAKVKL